jgi:aminopeptidase
MIYIGHSRVIWNLQIKANVLSFDISFKKQYRETVNNNFDKMVSSASGALEHLFKVSADDKILILTDSYTSTVADAFRKAFIRWGCAVENYVIKNNERPLTEIPSELEKKLPGKTIVLNIIKAFPEEIAFRIKWIFKVKENKLAKLGHMPGINEEMMLNSVNVDFAEMKSTAGKIINLLSGASRLHITTKEGTDLMLGVEGRIFIEDIGVKPGEDCNLPCGEVYCAPIETKADGVIIFDASIGDIGLLKHPLKVNVNNGRIAKFESEDNELVKKINELQNVDNDAVVIGELGIGVNPGARITGNMLEDEKALGTAHFAFGNNADFPGGGNNHSKIHRDYLFYKPTIEAHYLDGSSKLLMKNGEFVFKS